MSKYDEQFQPETIYQHIEHLSSSSEAPSGTSEAFLHDLRDLFQQEEEMIERVRARLEQASSSPFEMSTYNTMPSKNTQKGAKTMYNDGNRQPFMPAQPGSNTPSRSKLYRIFMVAATILIAVGLIGSISYVLVRAHQPGTQASITPTNGPATKPQTPGITATQTTSTPAATPTMTTNAEPTSCTPVAPHAVTRTPLASTGDPMLFYIVGVGGQQSIQVQTKLIRYDLITGQKTTLLATPQGLSLINAVLSPDKHWLLISSIFTSSQGVLLQVLRTDGQGLQNLYANCTIAGFNDNQGIRWSQDGSRIAFVGFGSGLAILTLATGQLQNYLSGASLNKVYWANDHQLTVQANGTSENVVYMLDTTKGTNQNLSDLTVLARIATHCARVTLSGDGSHLYNGSCSGNIANNQCQSGYQFSGQSLITSELTGSTSTSTIYSSAQDTMVAYEPIGTSQMLLYILNPSSVAKAGPVSHNGLWIINDDGTGLRQLTTETGINCWFQDGPYPDFQMASDGQYYASLQRTAGTSTEPVPQTLMVGKLSGGSSTTIENNELGAGVLVVVGMGEG